MSSNTESEDLENIPLVRMEDVQPARDRNCEVYSDSTENDIETCIVDDLDYDNEYIVDNDEDSNIGSMVSIHSEEVQEDSDSAEIIVPEVLDAKKEIKPTNTGYKYEEVIIEKNPESWPTLEILPGGVIKHSEKCEENIPAPYPDDDLTTESNSENMYACAKCPQTFKFLFCLVKHVRWHEIEKKLEKQRQEELSDIAPKYACLHSVKSKGITKSQRRIPKKTKS
ncbi:uncharacterized protein LOC128681082 [Plodia interpunctella]|uniref:uncharacterized protein LOC128681082 n=1 Tax=Plodia interpunctella TaxID=58824 RepID=UPI00236818C9|nr:uncharacterized protein LOC128681082 [Plodia interpunctella]